MSDEKQVKIKPLADRVVLRPLNDAEKNTKSVAGIIIPDTVSKDQPEQGVVIAVGEGKWNEDGDKRIPITVKEGDRVVFSKYGYDEIKIENQDYYLVSESSILAIINN